MNSGVRSVGDLVIRHLVFKGFCIRALIFGTNYRTNQALQS